jgi:hypothetical protein
VAAALVFRAAVKELSRSLTLVAVALAACISAEREEEKGSGEKKSQGPRRAEDSRGDRTDVRKRSGM